MDQLIGIKTDHRLVVIGAGGLSKQALPYIRKQQFSYFTSGPNAGTISKTIFVDETIKEPTTFAGFDVITSVDDIPFDSFVFMICIGHPDLRQRYHQKLVEKGGRPINAVYKPADNKATMGKGNLILTHALLEIDSVMGDGNLINCYAGLFHDVRIGDFNEIMPGAKLLGGVQIGNGCRIGTNATILPNVRLGNGVVIGAGAVVTKNIDQPGTYVGIPARKIKDK